VRGARAVIALLFMLAVPVSPAAAHHGFDVAPLPLTGAAAAAAALAPGSCPGNADSSFAPPLVMTGEFGTELEGSYVLLPFDVPAGTTAVRVRYCHDQPDAPTNAQIKHVLDLGIYDTRGPDGFFDEDEFRGWGGSSHSDVTVSPNGFSSEAQYLASPKGHVHGRTTRGFEPGAIPAGQWAVELGVAAVASQTEGDSDGKVAWRVEVQFSDDPTWANQPYQPAAYDSTPARSGAGWYAGDFHVHAEHSALGDATMRETFDYAFAPLAGDCGTGCASPGAGLDFITLSDYVSDTSWGEIGRYQPDYPGKLVMRSAEIITYQGHTNNHASVNYVDYRTGPVYERDSGGTLGLKRGAQPASALFDAVHAGGGFTQINHPTIFPSQVPGFDFLCRGCPWDYTDAETDYAKVDASEIATGPAGLAEDPQPGPNPFTPPAIQFWEHAIDANGPNSNKIAAVGSSDSHKAGRANTIPDIPSSPVGQATTVVYADELSEKGIQRGVQAGHTYVKLWGNDGPDLRLTAAGGTAIMGDTVHAGIDQPVSMTARVLNLDRARAARTGDYELFVIRNGLPYLATPIPPIGEEFEFPFTAVGPPARYRLQVQRNTAIEAVSSPIYVDAPDGYARPRSATPITARLVPAFQACGAGGAPNASHGAPLALPSCSPPAQASGRLTVGTPDSNGKAAASAGKVELRATGESPIDPSNGDQADVAITATVTDVSNRAGLSDYTGELEGVLTLRITDRRNGRHSDSPATVTDVPLSFPVPCTATSGQPQGATCATSTSADALIAGLAQEGKRSVWEVGQVRVYDGGSDGQAETPGNDLFAVQGLFTP
jgi:hypothetical protein